MKVVIAGGSGQVGTILARAFHGSGEEVVVLSRAAPHPIPNAAFMRVLRDASGVRFGLPASRWMLEIGALLMRTETELILKSRRVVPARLLEGGFEFKYPHWPDAARDLCQRWTMASVRRPGLNGPASMSRRLT